jgi:hypothetical protein
MRSAGIVRDFNLGLTLGGIVEEVDIAPFIEAVVRRPRRRVAEVVVDVRKADRSCSQFMKLGAELL